MTGLNNIRIAYIGGGSKAWARKFMSDLALQKEMSGEVMLYDISFEDAKNNEIIGNMHNEHAKALSKWNYVAVRDIDEALSGADFVVLSILPGTFDEMECDIHMPMEYGIYQPVGDSAGPGGILRAMRTIPIYEKIASAIKKYCPDAYVINLTNPMTLCTRTLYDSFPQIKAFGYCHEVFGTQEFLAKIVAEATGAENVVRHDISVDVMGVNHFTWFTRASFRDMDIFPMYKEYAQKHINDKCVNTDIMSSQEHVKMHLFLRYGQIAAAGDRHLVEFLNNNWYLSTADTLHKWAFGLTPIKWQRDDYKYKIKLTQKILNGELPLTIEPSGEELIMLMHGVLGVKDCISNVNITNNGREKWTAHDAVIECNAKFSNEGITPISSKPLNSYVTALVSRVSLQQENAFKAIKERDLNALYNVFMSEPLCSCLNLDQGKELFYKMINNTKKYLQDWPILYPYSKSDSEFINLSCLSI